MKDNLFLYRAYLEALTILLDKYFETQKEYISCKKGCSHCCEKGVYPYSQVEFEYLLQGIILLEQDKRQEVINRIKDLKDSIKPDTDFKTFMYRCPCLSEDGICEVYNYRGIICRTFGLIKINENNKLNIPFCHTLGLNYSNVYDEKTNTIIENPNCEQTPMAYDISLRTVKKDDFLENMPDFGETKSLIEWL